MRPPVPALSSRVRRPVAAVLAVAIAATLTGAVATSPAHAYPAATVELRGHGFGHGRGMGQYGALGYALAGWSSSQILDYYYGGTAAGSIGEVPMSVRIVRLDNLDTIVTQEQGGATTSTTPGLYRALKVHAVPATNLFEVSSSDSCTGQWTVIAQNVVGPIDLGSAIPQTDDRTTLPQLCEGTTTRWYRGHFTVGYADGIVRTVNNLGMEGYLRGVVPRESPASWGSLGGGAGMHALRAQAVAARSYAQAQNRIPGFAKTCDTESCQVYGGFGIQDATGYRDLESALTNTAVAETAGQVRVFTGTSTVVSTEFSSSTGGYTAGGTFPAVVDAGDSVASNTNHDWTASVPVPAIEAAYPSIGALQSVDVVRRNGLGDLGGRVLELVLVGTAARQTLSGDDFRIKFGLKSNWFLVTNNASGGVAGYWVVASDGGIFAFGAAKFYGSMGAKKLNQPVLGMAASPTGGGYWLVAADGGIFSFGDARFWGSTGAIKLNQPVVAMASSPTGNGYWLVAKDGGIFAFGDARFAGSTGAIKLNQPVVGMARTPTGSGYWLVASDGGIFAFGDARFWGSTGAIRLNQPVIGMAPTPTGNGYWLLAADGGIFAFGDARFLGSLPGVGGAGPARGIQATNSGGGYLVANDAGKVFAFGDAPFLGDVATAVPGYKGGVRGITARYTL
ncbi:MAG TPA: SpoIID/LytB domain-containing protein [Acidimicrobiales bacterium]|nr:SpoIID/LytB domain-containing protein [Acidimicrobiales bacterium]